MGSFHNKHKLAKKIEKLTKFLIRNYGLEAWNDFNKEEGRIRRSRQEAIYTKQEQDRMIRDYSIIGVASLVGCAGLGWMIWLITISVE